MSRFYSWITASMQPYVPGEQPKDLEAFIKLNTNESPYPPSPAVAAAVSDFACGDLRRYPDPDSTAFTALLAEANGLEPDQVLACGGSDEALAFAFLAFSNAGDKVYFPDITYGFYKVYAQLFGLQAVRIPLEEDFTVDTARYIGVQGNVYLANPNAPTGIAMEPGRIEELLQANPDRVVVVDEAYGDFAPGFSCMPLIHRYDNLLVVRTFSKSYALAGMRLGAAFGNRQLIAGMNRIKFSFNPYNLDRISLAVGAAAVKDKVYLKEIVEKITATRERTAAALAKLGVTVLPSSANFLFVSFPGISGKILYQSLREKNILVRHFAGPRTEDFVRVTIGTDQEMEAFLRAVERMG